MEGDKNIKLKDKKENDIFYSRSIKAGRRIYYLDVKKSRNDDYYLAITESKKRVTGYDDNVKVSYEKHKIFLYKEDFGSFVEGLEDVIDFIKREQGEPIPREEFYQKMNEEKSENDTEKEEQEEVKEKKTSFFDKFRF